MEKQIMWGSNAARQSGLVCALLGSCMPVLASGSFALILSAQENSVITYAMDSANGKIGKELSKVFVTLDPEDMSIYNNGKNVYTLSWYGNSISVLKLDQNTGALTHINEVLTGIQPWSVSFTPDGKCAYTGDYGSSDISQYTVDSGSGNFIPLAKAAFDSGLAAPAGLKITPDGQFLFAAYPRVNKVATFKINPQTCELSKTGFSVDAPAGTARFAMIGDYLYAASSTTNTIAEYHINDDKSLQPIGVVDSGGVGLMSLKPSNDNKYLYANNQTSNNIGHFKVNNDGSLAFINAISSMGIGPRSLTIDNSGKYAYEVNQYSNSITEFDIDSVTGNMIPMKGTQSDKLYTHTSPFTVSLTN